MLHLYLQAQDVVLQLQHLTILILQHPLVLELFLVDVLREVQPQLSFLIKLQLQIAVLLLKLPILNGPDLLINLPCHVLLLQGFD